MGQALIVVLSVAAGGIVALVGQRYGARLDKDKDRDRIRQEIATELQELLGEMSVAIGHLEREPPPPSSEPLHFTQATNEAILELHPYRESG